MLTSNSGVSSVTLGEPRWKRGFGGGAPLPNGSEGAFIYCLANVHSFHSTGKKQNEQKKKKTPRLYI